MNASTDPVSAGVLARWGPVTVTGPLGGGNRNSVLELRRGAERLVARQSRRSPASLDWEVGLLDHLARYGLPVPAVIPALDGRRHVAGVVVLSQESRKLPVAVRCRGRKLLALPDRVLLILR